MQARRSEDGPALGPGEYERRQAKDEERRRRSSAAGSRDPAARRPKRSTEAWVAAPPERSASDTGSIAPSAGAVWCCTIGHSDRRANIDHIAVVGSGVWVIDSKHFRGRLERREVSGWFVPAPVSSWRVATRAGW